MPGELKTLCVHILSRCNLACSHCWSASSPQSSGQVDLPHLFRLLSDLRYFGLKHVSISGGEPALHPELSYIVAHLLGMGLHLTVTTNATTRSTISSILSRHGIKPSKFLKIRVSIDGSQEVHDAIRGPGTYRRAFSRMSALRKINSWLGVNTVIFPGSSQMLAELARDIQHTRINDWAFITAIPRGRFSSSQLDLDATTRELLYCEQIARASGFTGSIRCWDYITQPNAYLLIEADGRILLPAVHAAQDIEVGQLGQVSAPEVAAAISKIIRISHTSFFSWSEDSL